MATQQCQWDGLNHGGGLEVSYLVECQEGKETGMGHVGETLPVEGLRRRMAYPPKDVPVLVTAICEHVRSHGKGT